MTGMSRTAIPRFPVRIEYEDDNYTYISSTYSWRQLKKDVEKIKRRITIVSQPL